MDPGYRILEHPADIGIESWGQTFPEALSMAVSGLVSILVNPATVEPAERRRITVTAADNETLVVRVLSEVLYLFDGLGFAPHGFQIESSSESEVRGFMTGELIRAGKHKLRLDVKAITYHQLSVRERSGRVSITVYLDI